MTKLWVAGLLIAATVSAHARASATGCGSGRTLADLARTAEVIAFGTLGQVEDAGYELADGTITKAAPGFGTAYRGGVKRLRIKVLQVIKGQPGGKLSAYLSVPALKLGDCPEKPLDPSTTAVFFLARRSSGYWVLDGQDGVIPTGERGVSATLSQFNEPVVVP
jgi:hypothetical protein